MYKFLIFDADNTLFDFNRAEKNAIYNIFADIGVEPNQQILDSYTKINTKLWHQYEKGKISQKKLKIQRFKLLFDLQGVKGDSEKASADYLIYLSQEACLIPSALDTVTELKKKYKLGLITNGIPAVQHPRLKKSMLNGLFDAVVVSGDVGISKPDARIFQILADRVNLSNKKEMIVIGDSLSSDIKGGINFGIDTCWFNPSMKKNSTGIIPTYEITSLRQINRLLRLKSEAHIMD